MHVSVRAGSSEKSPWTTICASASFCSDPAAQSMSLSISYLSLKPNIDFNDVSNVYMAWCAVENAKATRQYLFSGSLGIESNLENFFVGYCLSLTKTEFAPHHVSLSAARLLSSPGLNMRAQIYQTSILDSVLSKSRELSSTCPGSGPVFWYGYEEDIGYAQVLFYFKHLCKAWCLFLAFKSSLFCQNNHRHGQCFYSGLLFQQKYREGLKCEKSLCYIVSFCFKSENGSPDDFLRALSALFLSDSTSIFFVAATCCWDSVSRQGCFCSDAFLEGSCSIYDSVSLFKRSLITAMSFFPPLDLLFSRVDINTF